MQKIVNVIYFIFSLTPFYCFAEDLSISYGGFGSWDGKVGLGGMTFDIAKALDYGSDSFSDIKFCKSESKFICVTSQHMSFSIPRNINDKQRTWTFEGREFSFQARIFRSIPDGKIQKKDYVWNLEDMGLRDKAFLIERTTIENDYESYHIYIL